VLHGSHHGNQTIYELLINYLQASDDANADVTAAVEELLNSLSSKFAGVSSEIFAKSKFEQRNPRHRPRGSSS
jgi:hypothetical protein